MEAENSARKRKCCCGLLPLTETFEFIVKLIVLSDIFMFIFFLTMIILLIEGLCGKFGRENPNWYIDFVKPSK